MRVARWLLLLVSLSVGATESPTLAQAISHFQAGRFVQVKEQLSRLKSSPTLTDPDQQTLRCYLAAAHHALGEVDQARAELVALFERFPSAQLDPGEFVPALIELAAEVRPAATVLRMDAPRSLTLTGPPPPPPAVALTFLPFGVGHFAHQAPAKGTLLLVGEAVLFAASAVALGLLESSKVESYGFLQGGTYRDLPRAQALNVTVVVGFYGGLALATYGAYDAWKLRAERFPK